MTFESKAKVKYNFNVFWVFQGFWGSGENGYLFSWSWGGLVIILGEWGSKHAVLGI